ncbi:MAG: hypothetical protein K6F93_06940 [Lachnospiraceae bacterium]|nr:hypothetical protein [Lachnospiraceae bacterium]
MKDERLKNAYMSVEAAFVFPIVICLVLAVICLSFYMFGRVSITCDSDRLLLEEERDYRDTGETDNVRFYDSARKRLTGYPLCNSVVSRCYGDYGDMVVEYRIAADIVENFMPGEIVETMTGKPTVRHIKADNRIEKARYLSVGKSVYTKVKGYATGWRRSNGN